MEIIEIRGHLKKLFRDILERAMGVFQPLTGSTFSTI